MERFKNTRATDKNGEKNPKQESVTSTTTSTGQGEMYHNPPLEGNIKSKNMKTIQQLATGQVIFNNNAIYDTAVYKTSCLPVYRAVCPIKLGEASS